jgi:hypothetical protein
MSSSIEEPRTSDEHTPKVPPAVTEEIAPQDGPELVGPSGTTGFPVIKIPNVTERPTDSQPTTPSSDGTAVNNTPTTNNTPIIRQNATFVPKPLIHTQRTDSSVAVKGSPKIQNLSRTFTSGVTKVGTHKLWNQNQEHHDGQTQWGVNWYMPSHMAFLGAVSLFHPGLRTMS